MCIRDRSFWQAGARPEGVTSGTFYARFRRYLKLAGMAPTGIHVLRHTATQLRRDAGESIESVSQFLDHSSLAVTSVYLRRLEGQEDLTWREQNGRWSGCVHSRRPGSKRRFRKPRRTCCTPSTSESLWQ